MSANGDELEVRRLPTPGEFSALQDPQALEIVKDLRRLERANMEEAFERFSRALRRDQILPEDF